MTVPPIPKKADKKLFPNINMLQQQKDYFRKIRDALMALSKSLSKGRDKQIIMSFTGCINPGGTPDPARLPFECRTDHKSRFEGKSECLFAKVNKLIQNYWKFYASNDTADLAVVDTDLKLIEQVTKNGLSAYKIEGNIKEGFELIEK